MLTINSSKKEGMKTAFVLRPTEHGSNQSSDLKPSQDWDFIVDNFHELADKLKCKKEG